MMDTEIIKALEDHYKKASDAYVGYLAYGGKSDEHEEKYLYMIRDALDLINRLQADNERLKMLLAEEEAQYKECAKRFYKEAIKEFAKRLKENTREFGSASGVQREVDNLVKEMVGDAE